MEDAAEEMGRNDNGSEYDKTVSDEGNKKSNTKKNKNKYQTG